MVQAIILAAGGGARLYPLTDVIPKIMVPVGVEQYPLAHMIVDHCMDHGITEFLFCLNDQSGKQVMNYLGNGARFGCNVQYSFSSEPQGTAGELKLAWEKGLVQTPAIIYYGDTLCSTNLSLMMQMHEKRDADVSIVIKQVRIAVGYIEDDKDGNVMKIVEKPHIGDMVKNAGGVLPIFYVEDDEFFMVFCRRDTDVMRDVFPIMIQNSYKLVTFRDTQPFLDLGNWKNYEKAKKWV